MPRVDDYLWLFRNAPTMASAIGEDGRFIDVNDALLARLGYSRDEMVARRPGEFLTAESATRVDEELLPTLRRTGRLENKAVDFVTKSGEIVSCLTNSLMARDADDATVRTVATYTERSGQARADLKYRQLYRATPAMLHTVDAEGCVLTVTDHWLQKMGYARDEVVGRSIMDFYSEADRKRFAAGRLKDVISGGEFTNQERQMVSKDGQVLDLVMSAISDRDETGRVYRMLVASKDVTERKRAERNLRVALAENARLKEEIERERDYLREEVNVAMNFGRIVGDSPALKRMLSKVEAVAQTPANVLILGESGVGKELVARAIHVRSPRAEAPLVKVNCASIPKELFESEFFGHVKGAFTGAQRDRVGRFQLADGGTIFLDEVGEIPLELQGKLLRVLQEGEFEKVGDDFTRSVDVRVIAATNRNIEELMVAGEFREDLFYRLSVFPIEVPPLRDRPDDVIQLAQHFLESVCRDFGRPSFKLTQSQASVISAYDWPGNVRELKNVIERAVILSNGNTLRLDLSMPGARQEATAAAGNVDGDRKERILTDEQMRELQKANIVAALKATNWKVSGKDGTAELLGVRPTTLYDRLKALGIRKPAK